MASQPKSVACDSARIVRFLHDQLGDAEHAAFESHLDQCTLCRAALEAETASAALWRDARHFLSTAGDVADDSDQRGADPTSDGALGDEHALQISAVVAMLAPTDDPRMLGRLGVYEITGVIGAGGMGVVLKGFDRSLDRYVAIKVLSPQLAAHGAARQRFAREARAAAAVVHDNVVAIHSVAETNHVPYFVMPYLRAGSLQKRLDEQGPLDVAEILRIALQIATGLAAAHAQGLVHRDIKPANVLVEGSVERVKITDFGLARAVDDASLTRTGVIAGTPQYMSPEQARGEPVDYRSDLFSLGSVMYAMCTGRPPFRAETSLAVLRRICDTEPRSIRELNPRIPDWLAAIVTRLHAKAPEGRYGSAEELAHLLEQCLAHIQQPTVSPLPANLLPVRGHSLGRSPRFWWALAASCLLMGAAALAFVFLSGNDADHTNAEETKSLGKVVQETSTDEHAWDDQLDQRLLELDHDSRLLEQQAIRLWGDGAPTGP